MSIQRKNGICWTPSLMAKVLMRKCCCYCERHSRNGIRWCEVLQSIFNVDIYDPFVSIQVKYAPKLAVTIVEGALDTGRIPEGNSIKLLCTSNANPSDVAFQWYMNDEQIVDATLNELVISRAHAKAINYYFQVEKSKQTEKTINDFRCAGNIQCDATLSKFGCKMSSAEHCWRRCRYGNIGCYLYVATAQVTRRFFSIS